MTDTGRILGIDYGSKRVGVAVSDLLRILAQGLGALDNTPDLVQRIAALIGEHDVAGVVVGVPYAPDGGLGAKGEEVMDFVARLQGAVSVPVETWDESHTSRDAQRILREGGMKRKGRRDKARVDVMAARLLLQEYLESQRHQPARER